MILTLQSLGLAQCPLHQFISTIIKDGHAIEQCKDCHIDAYCNGKKEVWPCTKL